jgi:hypothetical protein
MKKPRLLILAGLLALQMQVASAKDAIVDLPVEGAAAAGDATPLPDAPYFMAGQTHPEVVKAQGEYTSNKSSNAATKSTDTKSIKKHNDLVSAAQFRFVDGAFASNVALTGTVATLK